MAKANTQANENVIGTNRSVNKAAPATTTSDSEPVDE
jgi:hypothetical protein